MKKHVKINGWLGEGDTLAAAKKDAIAKSERAAEGYYTPLFIRWKGAMAIIYREPLVWTYVLTFADDPQGVLREKAGQWCQQYTNKEIVVREALRHLATVTYIPGEPIEIPPFLTHPEDRAEYLNYARWQNGYKAYKDTHPQASDQECHRAAAKMAANQHSEAVNKL
jgi:hypothetical protein